MDILKLTGFMGFPEQVVRPMFAILMQKEKELFIQQVVVLLSNIRKNNNRKLDFERSEVMVTAMKVQNNKQARPLHMSTISS